MTRNGWAAGAVPARGVKAALTLLACGVTLSIFLHGQDRGGAPSEKDEMGALNQVVRDLQQKDPQFELSKDVLDELSKLLADPNARPGWVARHLKLVDLTADQLRDEVQRARQNPSRQARGGDPVPGAPGSDTSSESRFSGLSDEERRLLWARGVPAALLDLPEAMPSDGDLWWHAPAVVASEVLRSEKLPSAKALIELDRGLRRVEEWAVKNRKNIESYPEFRVAHDLLDRALGVDDKDFGGSDKRPVAAPQSQEKGEWQDLCKRLNGEGSWGWELLARLLNSPSSTDADELGKLLANVKKVLPEDAPEARLWTTCEKLIQRVREKKLESPGELALAADVRERQRRERAKKEQEFLQAWQAGDNNDKILCTMQEAKAAGLGLDPNRIVSRVGSLDDPNTLQGLLRDQNSVAGRNNPGVHLYVELLRVEEACYALLLWADKPVLTNVEKRFLIHRISSPTVNGVLSAAMDKLKEMNRGRDFNARVVVALDVVDPGQLIDARKELLRCVQQTEEDAWFLVLPSAAALLDNSPWNEEAVLRFVYRLAAPLPGNPAPLWRPKGTKQEVASVPSPSGGGRRALLLAFHQDPNGKPADGGELHVVCGQLKNDPNLALTLPILVSGGRQ